MDSLIREGCQPDCAPLGALLALVTTGDFETAEWFLKFMLDKGLQPSGIHEILLEAHLFAGFPRAIHALQIFDRLLRERGRNILECCHIEDSRPCRRRSRGEKLFKKVYRRNTDAVLNSLRALYPRYDRWILEDAYGRVLSRPFLPLKVRELCAVAALTVSGVPMQLRSHIMGAIHQGATRRDVEGIIRSVQSLTDVKKIDDALEILEKLDLK